MLSCTETCASTVDSRFVLKCSTRVFLAHSRSLYPRYALEIDSWPTPYASQLSGTLQNVLDNPKSAPEKVQELVYEFAENIITILWCLSYVPLPHSPDGSILIVILRETSNKALNAINSISLVPFLMAFLINRAKLPRQVVHAAGKFFFSDLVL
jgi:hypothetical protein